MIWIVGAGNMSYEYARALKDLNNEFQVIGRGPESAKNFKDKTGIDVLTGGLEHHLTTANELPESIILATPVQDLFTTLKLSIEAGIKNILVEKPGFMFPDEGEEALRLAQEKKVNVFIAYNRRFFSSVLKMNQLIELDGGLKSFHFEFTEWADDIEKLASPKITLERWVLSNSTHVIDLAFHIGSTPEQFACKTMGGFNWHPSASYFSGMGKTQSQKPFTYFATWDSPGRWGLEFFTKNKRFILRPMEKLSVQNRNSVVIEEIQFDNSNDLKCKPGLLLMIEAFLGRDADLRKKLCTLEEHVKNFQHYCKMANY